MNIVESVSQFENPECILYRKKMRQEERDCIIVNIVYTNTDSSLCIIAQRRTNYAALK